MLRYYFENDRQMKSIYLFVRFFMIIFFVTQVNGQDRIITTGVPFLLITPDARAAGMAEPRLATSADADVPL